MNIEEDMVYLSDTRKDFVGGRDTRNGNFVPGMLQLLLLQQPHDKTMQADVAYRLTHPRVPVTRVPVPGTG